MTQQLYPVEQFPLGHIDMLVVINSIGGLLESQGEYKAAIKYFRQALQMHQQLFPADQPPTELQKLALLLNNLGLVLSQQGEYGEEVDLVLEMKLLADAALIGYPNAGKSTLIARVSAAKPKIADYPFTTLSPNLGVVTVGEREMVLADIPGLIEGAASGRGLGHEFLRHTERARALVVLLDPSELQEDAPSRQLEVLLEELAAHNPELAAMPRIITLSKSDVLDASGGQNFDLGDDVIEFSGLTGEGIDELMYRIADVVAAVELTTPERDGFVLHRPLRDDFTIRRDGSEWVVEGIAAVRAVNLADLTDPDAAQFVSTRLERSGIVGGLREAGAVSGDDVRIGSIVFTFDPDLDADTEFEI